MPIQLQVHKATLRDQPLIVRLLTDARRSFAAFGMEDLPRILTSGNCFVAEEGGKVWSFVCASVNRSNWAYLRGAAIANGYRTEDALQAVLEPLITWLRKRQVTHLAVYGTEMWLAPALIQVGFDRLAWIVSLERHPQPVEAWRSVASPVDVRHIRPHDLTSLAALDAAAFDAPYQMASGELIELMVTTGYFAVAEAAGGDAAPLPSLAGYVCADVVGDTGQVIRLAVHPEAQRLGIGRTLLNEALAYCQANGASRVVINTQEDNAASFRLYEQAGFRRVGRRVPLLVRRLVDPAADAADLFDGSMA